MKEPVKNILTTVLFDEVDGFHCRTAGCQHGIHYKDISLCTVSR